ncbi:hypothetical protein BM1_05658 [Bipolaris maydis]|nr:hypothetical protein BM1_05658 [Bipolaris maydis]
MAITQETPGLEVHVECNGARLQEFDEDDGETTTTTVTKYIEAKSAAEFAVHIEVHRPFSRYAMIVKLYIDGKSVCSRIIGDHQYQRAKGSVKRVFNNTVTKIAEGQCTLRMFCFSELQIDSYDYNLEDGLTKDLKLIGIITLKAYYIENLREVCINRPYVDKKQTGVGPIPEKALKGQALTHCAELGREVKEPYHMSPTRTDYDYVNLQRLPFAAFNFKYRSRAALQSLLVIPRSPSPLPTQAKEDGAHVINVAESEQGSLPTKVKKDSGPKREYSATFEGSKDDDEVSFVSAAKRPRPNITVNKRGVEIIDLT